MRKEPRWVVAFLRALERTGVARAAARDAAVDWSTAYARRRAHPEFAERWAEALKAHEARVKAEEEGEVAGVRSGQTPPLPPTASLRVPPSPAEGGGAEFAVSAGKVRRVSGERWGKRKEKTFFEMLAVTASISLAADAAGVSTNAILARRHKSRLFAAKFDAVLHNAKALIDLFLAEEARRSFDAGDLDISEARPRVTIDQAIKISQSLGSRFRGAASNPFHDEDSASEEDESVKQQLIARLSAFGARVRREQMDAGWTYDESFDAMIPPGYVRGPDYRPEAPGPPEPSD